MLLRPLDQSRPIFLFEEIINDANNMTATSDDDDYMNYRDGSADDNKIFWKNPTTEQLQTFLLRIPKADLHIHLDGSIRIKTLIDLAQKYDVALPSYDVQELKEMVFPETYKSLEEYLRGFGYITKVLVTPEALERVAYEVAMDAYNVGVRYIEVRFAPQMHAIPGKLSVEEVICAVNTGLERAVKDADEFDLLSGHILYDDDDDFDGNHDTFQLDKCQIEKIQQLKDKKGRHPYHPEAPSHHYGIIACAMRFFLPVFSPYYEAFYEVHKGEDPHRVFGLASVALVTAVNNLRRRGRCSECDKCNDESSHDDAGCECKHRHHDYILPVVALDIAGAESGYPASDHREAFDLAHQSFLHKTVHAGEGKNEHKKYMCIEKMKCFIVFSVLIYDDSLPFPYA